MLQAPAGSVTIEGVLPDILAEESSATQCFSNLLGNAVKFVPKDRIPEIRLFAEDAGSLARVWVTKMINSRFLVVPVTGWLPPLKQSPQQTARRVRRLALVD